MTDQRAYLADQGLYRPECEGDACGVGLIAASMHKWLKAKASAGRAAA